MQDQPKAPVVIYAAKSTEDKRGSIPTQLDDCRAFAARESLTEVGHYSDEAASAWSGDRGPQLAAALDHAERLGASLIVQHSDRLARGDARKARHLIEIYLWSIKTGVSLRSVQDDSTFENLIMAAVMGERNTEDSRRKSEAVKAGLARRRARGKYIGSRGFGLTWRRNAADEREVVPEPAEAVIVERMVAEFLGGLSQLKIAQNLYRDGIPTARGGTWRQATVRNILSNPAIAGLIRDGDGFIEAEHDGIIDRATWDEMEALRATRARTYRRGRPSSGQHLFRKGFLRCGKCGAPMVPRTVTNRSGSVSEFYLCHGRRLDPDACDMLPAKRSEVDAAVFSYFEQVALDLEATREQLVAAADRKLGEVRALREAAEREAQKASDRLSRVKSDYTHGELTAAEWRELRAELEPERRAADAEVERLREQVAATEKGVRVSDVETELLEQLANIRAAVAGEIDSASGVKAVRSTLMRLFDGFNLHEGTPENAHVELIGTRWIEPLVSEQAIQGQGQSLSPAPAPVPLDQAENNCYAALLL
jgi:site-specific DNA recombinase